MLVECGVFRRPVTFSGDDINSLKNAIVGSFSDLAVTHIALMQIKSEEFDGQFVDILDPGMSIEHNSFIKIVLHYMVRQ